MCLLMISSAVYPSSRSAPRLQAFTMPSKLKPRIASPDARKSAAYFAASARRGRYRVDVDEAENRPIKAAVGHAIRANAHKQRLRFVICRDPNLALDVLASAQHDS